MPQKSNADHKSREGLPDVKLQKNEIKTLMQNYAMPYRELIRYKKGLQESDHVDQELFECAKMSAELDSRMEKLQQFVGDLYE